MALVTKKTTKLTGELQVNGATIKTYVVDINNHGVSTVYENTLDEAAYASNRKEMRKQEAEFRDLRYELEDKILQEIEEAEEAEAK